MIAASGAVMPEARLLVPMAGLIDLAAACDLDRAALLANLEAVCPGRPVLFTSARTGEGFPEWLAWLAERRAGWPASGGS